MPLPSYVDTSRWSPAEDRKGRPVKPGDYVSVPRYPRGTVRGILEVSARSWASLPDGSQVASLVIVGDDGTRYEARKILLLEERTP